MPHVLGRAFALLWFGEVHAAACALVLVSPFAHLRDLPTPEP